MVTAGRVPSFESRIKSRLTADGSVIVSPRVARWLERQAGITADRRIRLRDTDPEAYIALTALHLAALCSDSGTNHAVRQHHGSDLEMWMSTSQAAKALNVTDRCIRKRCDSGRLDAVRSGSRWFIHRKTIALQGITT